MPSRRFYVTKIDDYEDVKKTVKRKRLSLPKKSQFIDLTEDCLSKVEDMITKVLQPQSLMLLFNIILIDC
jgi:disulfide oxidoreductase YuzD